MIVKGNDVKAVIGRELFDGEEQAGFSLNNRVALHRAGCVYDKNNILGQCMHDRGIWRYHHHHGIGVALQLLLENRRAWLRRYYGCPLENNIPVHLYNAMLKGNVVVVVIFIHVNIVVKTFDRRQLHAALKRDG